MPITLDLLDEAHARAALDPLEADGGLTVYEGVVPADPTTGQAVPPPYVLVYTSVQWPSQGDGKTLDGRTGMCVTRWYCHCAGASDQAARAVAGRVRQLLLDRQPAIAGRSCGFIRQEASPPPSRDQTIGSLVQDIVSVYVLYTFAG